MAEKKVALVTGASSGIGKETAIALYRCGFTVYGAARRTDLMTDLAQEGIKILNLDVTIEQSMIECVETIKHNEGRLDVLVNNAGYGSYGAIEDVPLAEARYQVEVNLFGLARMIQLAIPLMRAQHYGKIVNISSMAGRVWTPFGGWYHATKFAVEGLSHALRLELKPFNIDVILIEPGAIATPWATIAADNLLKTSGQGIYAPKATRTAKKLTKTYSKPNLTQPKVIAHCIAKAVTTAKPKTRYLLGYGAKLSVFMQNLLGDKLYDKLIQIIMS